MPDFIELDCTTDDEFKDILKKHPNKLKENSFMDFYDFYDFSLADDRYAVGTYEYLANAKIFRVIVDFPNCKYYVRKDVYELYYNE